MILIDKIKAWILCFVEERFWKNSDKFFVSIILDEEKGNQVYGKVKNDLAILQGIPKPETG